MVSQLKQDKEGLEGSMAELKQEISQLEGWLQEAKDQQRLLVEYPDLNGPVNANIAGECGDGKKGNCKFL